MAITALKCPSCAADIQVDDDKEYGFCSYCGTKIQTREVVEIRYTGQIQMNDTVSIEKQLEDGLAYIKMEDYYKAEKVFFGTIKDYPGRPEGYEMLIRAITHDHRIFIQENMERVMKLADKMLAVAPEEKRDYYESLYASIEAAYSQGLIQQQMENNLVKISKNNKMIKENLIVFILSLVLLIITRINNPEDAVMTVVFCAVAAFAILTIVVCKQGNMRLLQKNEKLDEEMSQS